MKVQIVSYNSPDASKTFANSLKDTGFAVIKDHPVSKDLLQDFYQEWLEFFKSDYKHNYLYNSKNQDGYIPFGMEKAKDSKQHDLKEFYNVYTWGLYPKELSGKALQIHNDLNKIAKQLLIWLQEQLPEEISAKLSMPLDEMVNESKRHLLRIIHYPVIEGDTAGRIRAAQHEDINLITLLPVATVAGLQLMDKDGEWFDVPYEPGTIIVNAGDMLQMCTDTYYVSTTHRVRNPEAAIENASRISAPLFVHPEDEVVLSKQHTALSYLRERLIQNGIL